MSPTEDRYRRTSGKTRTTDEWDGGWGKNHTAIIQRLESLGVKAVEKAFILRLTNRVEILQAVGETTTRETTRIPECMTKEWSVLRREGGRLKELIDRGELIPTEGERF